MRAGRLAREASPLGASLSPTQVPPRSRVCFHEMQVLREQREYAVLTASRRERDAWTELIERANRSDDDDPDALRGYRERWQAASRRLVEALEALKTSRR